MNKSAVKSSKKARSGKVAAPGRAHGSATKKVTAPKPAEAVISAGATEPSLTQQPQMDEMPNATEAEVSDVESETTPIIQPVRGINEMSQDDAAKFDTAATDADLRADTESAPETNVTVEAVDDQQTPASEHGDEQTIEDTDSPEVVASESAPNAVTDEIPSPVDQKRPRAKTKEKVNLGPRYEHACAEVARLRKELLSALDDQAMLLGTKRKGESLEAISPEVESLNAEIKEARHHLGDLLKKKRELKSASPELQAVSERVNRLRREREEWRWRKKTAFAEAVQTRGAEANG